MKFEEFDLSPDLMDGIMSLGFEDATAIQEQTIPLILEGEDLIACAQTGTGKTAAFLIPTLEKLVTTQLPEPQIRVIIIVPTRELALQIDQNMEALAYFTGVASVAVYGGKNSGDWDQQKRAIVGGVDMIVATPGRFKTHLALGYMDLSQVDTVILDEADKMLDMGFYSDILEIIGYLPKDKPRQTLMFSATMPNKIRKLAKDILKEPKEVAMAISKPAAGIEQTAYVVYENQKIPLLESILSGKEVDSMIIFASSKASVDRITDRLKGLGFGARAIHSDREQDERQKTLSDFKNKQFPVLVATDVLSRGIDVDNLSHVLNYDVPRDAEDYVHRVGRTARASSTGEALTFITPDEVYRFVKIERLIEREVPKGPVPEELGETPPYNPSRGGRGNRRSGGRNHRKGGRGRNYNRNNQHPREGGEHRNRGGNQNRNRNRRRKKGNSTGNNSNQSSTG
ncbi:MAG: DEAD/DEAH box helicase [Bacteroidota bacterium]